MKTIIDRHNCSKYLFEDDEFVIIKSDSIDVGSPLRFIVNDLNLNNCELIPNVTPPMDEDGNNLWRGCKYNYVNGAWIENSNWQEPITE